MVNRSIAYDRQVNVRDNSGRKSKVERIVRVEEAVHGIFLSTCP